MGLFRGLLPGPREEEGGTWATHPASGPGGAGGGGVPGREGGTKVLSGQVEGMGAPKGGPLALPRSFSAIAHLLHFPSFISPGLHSPSRSARFFLRSCHPPSPTQGPARLPPSPS